MLGQVVFIFYYCKQVLFALRVSPLLSPLNDASVDIFDDEGSFQFPPEAEFASLLYVLLTRSYVPHFFTNHDHIENDKLLKEKLGRLS